LAGIEIAEVRAIKTHNPFAVNDVYFSREMGVKKEAMNNYGCLLFWGHPQGPTGMRLVEELIGELVILGGGYGLFVGCAAGDTAAAVVVKVSEAA
jgi:acetyl-CoA acyltransferase